MHPLEYVGQQGFGGVYTLSRSGLDSYNITRFELDPKLDSKFKQARLDNAIIAL